MLQHALYLENDSLQRPCGNNLILDVKHDDVTILLGYFFVVCLIKGPQWEMLKHFIFWNGCKDTDFVDQHSFPFFNSC